MKGRAMDTARQIQVIETTLLRRGKGDTDDPVRAITQHWSLDGELLAEVDPCPEVEWGDKAAMALIDAPEGDTSGGRPAGFYEGWYAARDAVYQALTGHRYGT